MEQDYLESLGYTDDELADLFVSLTNGDRPSFEGEDGPDRRRRVFDAVCLAQRNTTPLDVAPLRSFAEDDPTTHAAHANGPAARE